MSEELKEQKPEQEQEQNPLRPQTLEEFAEIEGQIFETPEDQEKAERIYQAGEANFEQARINLQEKVGEKTKILLKPGTVVYRRGNFQIINHPFEIKAGMVGKNEIAIPLPDGSTMYANNVEILESSQEE